MGVCQFGCNEIGRGRKGRGTYEAAEDHVAGLDGHLTPFAVIERHRRGALAVGTKGPVQPDTLHGVMQDGLVRLGRVEESETS